MRGENKKKENPSATPPLLSVLSSLSSHSLPSNHLALIHDSSVYRCLCSLCPLSLPSCCFLPLLLAWSLTHSLLTLHLMYYWRTQQAEWKRKKERKGGREREKSLWHRNTRGEAQRVDIYGGKRTDGECVQGDWTRVCSLSTPDTPKLVHIIFFGETYICKLILTCLTNTLLLSLLLPLSLLTNTRSC